MKPELTIVETADGSKTIYNAQVGENYHSIHGALQESQHVFLEAGLKYFLEKGSGETTPIEKSAPSKGDAPSKSPPVGETYLSVGEEIPTNLSGFYRENADPVYYRQLKDFSRENRKDPTEAENRLWQFLRKEQTGFKIRRQHAIDIYIVDFVCLQKGLVIEIDGHHHKLTKEADDARTETLNYFGFTVIRFNNDLVLQNSQQVFDEIYQTLNLLADMDLTKMFGSLAVSQSPTQPFPVGRAFEISTGEAKVSLTGGDLEGAFRRLEAASVSILEVGFGTGLNFLLTADHCAETKIQLNYTGIEAFPLSKEMITQTGYDQYVSAPAWHNFIEKYDDSLKTDVSILPNSQLQIAHLTLNDFQSDQQFDIIYFDAFASARQPEMWDEAAIAHTIQFLKPGGVFVTYAITGNLKRALKALGCKVEKAPGAPGKREMLRATKMD